MSSTQLDTPTTRQAPTLLVERWPQEEEGESPVGFYAEMFWLPIIGPSSLWLFRRLNMYLAANEASEIPLDVLAAEIGVQGVGKNSPVNRSLDRLVRFGLARGSIHVRQKLGPLGASHLRRLPHHLQALHAKWAER